MPQNFMPDWPAFGGGGNGAGTPRLTDAARAFADRVAGIGGQSLELSECNARIDEQAAAAVGLANTAQATFATRFSEIADIRDWGVVHDPAGSQVDQNTDKFLAALAKSAGHTRLHVPADVTIVTRPLVIPSSGWTLCLDGTIRLAAGSAGNASIRANHVDFHGNDWHIYGIGLFDGNRSQQSWTVGQVVGGLTSNSWKTTETWLLDAGASNAIPIRNFLIEGVQVANYGNWPVSFGYATNGVLKRVLMRDSGNSPQWFAGAVDCVALDCTSRTITDAGFSLYAGTTRCSVVRGVAVNCHQGFGSYCEDSTRLPNIDPLVLDCLTVGCRDGSIGFTTGGNQPTQKQIRPMARGNRSVGDGVSGTNGVSAIGVVGCLNPAIISNTALGFGATAKSGAVTQGFFADSTTSGLILEDNLIESVGSAEAPGVGYVFADSNAGLNWF